MLNNNINYRTKNGMIILNYLVKFLLITDPELRDSDMKLINRVYEVYQVDTYNTSFFDVTQRIARNEIPSFESVRRSRQKIQEQNNELKSSYSTQIAKDNIQEEFYDFSKENED